MCYMIVLSILYRLHVNMIITDRLRVREGEGWREREGEGQGEGGERGGEGERGAGRCQM